MARLPIWQEPSGPKYGRVKMAETLPNRAAPVLGDFCISIITYQSGKCYVRKRQLGVCAARALLAKPS